MYVGIYLDGIKRYIVINLLVFLVFFLFVEIYWFIYISRIILLKKIVINKSKYEKIEIVIDFYIIYDLINIMVREYSL